jgi:catechol 2,3-dioxygenase-like lactoylglutathione lyase family enzyme
MTPDVEAALEFYGDILGLPLARRSADQLVFEVGGASLHVFRCERPAGDGRHGRDASSVITFEVESLDAEVRRLRARGVAFIHERPVRNELAGLRYVAFVAPGGNVHELVERG